MNNDGTFDLLADMICDTHQVPPLGINKAKNVSFHNTRFLSPKHAQNMLPKLCKSLTFRYCEFYSLDEFIIKTKISEILKFDGNNMKSCKKIEIHDVKNIEFDGRYNGTNIEIFDVSKIKIIKSLSIKNVYTIYDNLGFIKLNNNIDVLILNMSFERFDNCDLHCNNYLILNIDKNLKNYYNVTNISCDDSIALRISDVGHGNFISIISILLVNTNKMYITDMTKSVLAVKKHPINIMQKYVSLDLSERKDQIMDCALELIDAGFEEAAEL